MSDRYRLLIDNLPDAFAYHQLITDSKGVPVDYIFLLVNRAFAKMTGLPEDRVMGKKVTEVIPKITESSFDWIGTYGKVAITGETVFFEEYSEALERWYEVTAYSDKPGYFAVLFRNITEYKQMQAELQRESKELTILLNEMLDTVAIWIDILDIDGNVVFWNKAAEQISGYTAEEVTGHAKIWEWLYPNLEYRAEILEKTRNLIQKGEKAENLETQIIRKDGQERTILWHSNNFMENGEVIGRIALGADITERKQAEKTLHATQEQYHFFVNNVNEAMTVAQDDFHIFVNPEAARLFKSPEAELTTKPFVEFIHPDDRDMVLGNYRKRLKGDPVAKRYSYRVTPADGSIKWVEVSSVAIEWDGRPAALALISDITERKIMEQEIFKADKLESIGILAGGIAHDFNNYLAILLGNTSLAKLCTDNPQKILEKLENIENAILRAKGLSNQLFTFAKGAAPVKKTVSLGHSMVDNITFTLSGSNISCDYAIAKNLHLVEIDEGQFSQVLNNLVLNAVQAMPEGGTIRVGAENVNIKTGSEASFVRLGEGNYVKISIKDEGIGIPEKHLEKIYDPFFTTKQKGSGFGLATSYSIIKNHGGHLSVESKIEVGTTFSIYLPASKQADTTTIIIDNIFYGTGKILVMDDQEDYLEVTGETLTTFGYEVSLAKDGREAIEVYMDALNQGRPFDLVIMDLTVPGGMGGQDTIKKMLNKDPQAKAIVASGYSNDPVMANYRDYGFEGVIKKPFAIAELSKLVYDIIKA